MEGALGRLLEMKIGRLGEVKGVPRGRWILVRLRASRRADMMPRMTSGWCEHELGRTFGKMWDSPFMASRCKQL